LHLQWSVCFRTLGIRIHASNAIDCGISAPRVHELSLINGLAKIAFQAKAAFLELPQLDCGPQDFQPPPRGRTLRRAIILVCSAVATNGLENRLASTTLSLVHQPYHRRPHTPYEE
jgi:hypothetical protein